MLAAAAAAVSFTAQYRMAETARHLPVIAALEAAIPDAAALVFACLGIALALHGRRALRARTLNLASVAASVFMNAIAAEPGWRNLAIWAMPPAAYALASDTLIGVVRAWALARHQHLAGEAATPLAIVGGLLPVEPVWPNLKRSLANLVKQDIGHLTALIKTRLRRMQYQPGLLEGFLAKPRLDLTRLQ